MKKGFLMALMALAVSANASARVVNDDESNNFVIEDGELWDWTMHLGVGVNLVSDAPDGYSFAPFKSWDVRWTPFSFEYTPKNASQTYSIGLGFNWRNFGLKDNGTAFVKGGDVVGLGLFPAGTGSHYSSVHLLSLNVPLLFTQRINKNFAFSLGPVVNFNTGAWLKSDYKTGDVVTNLTTKKVGQRPVTVDIFAEFEAYGVGLFCKYAPMSVFKKDRGPEFKSFTVGLYF